MRKEKQNKQFRAQNAQIIDAQACGIRLFEFAKAAWKPREACSKRAGFQRQKGNVQLFLAILAFCKIRALLRLAEAGNSPHSAAKVSARCKQTCMRRKRIHEVREVSAKLAKSHCGMSRCPLLSTNLDAQCVNPYVTQYVKMSTNLDVRCVNPTVCQYVWFKALIWTYDVKIPMGRSMSRCPA